MDVMIRLDFLRTRLFTVHSSVGVGVAVNFTMTSISSPFIVLYFLGVSGLILGGVSITRREYYRKMLNLAIHEILFKFMKI